MLQQGTYKPPRWYEDLAWDALNILFNSHVGWWLSYSCFAVAWWLLVSLTLRYFEWMCAVVPQNAIHTWTMIGWGKIVRPWRLVILRCASWFLSFFDCSFLWPIADERAKKCHQANHFGRSWENDTHCIVLWIKTFASTTYDPFSHTSILISRCWFGSI